MKKLALIFGLLATVAIADLGNPSYLASLKPKSAGGSPNWIIVKTNISQNTIQVHPMPVQDHAAGNMLVVGVYTAFGTVSVSSISNTAGDTFTLCTGSKLAPDEVIEWWHTPSSAGSAVDVITVTLTGARNASIVSFEVSGQASSSPFETAATGSATGTSVTSASFSPAASGNLNLAYHSVIDGTAGAWTAGTGYTLSAHETANNIRSEYRIGAPAGAQTASATFASSQALKISVVSFKPQL